MSTTQQQIEAWKAHLLDTSAHNRLLHCRVPRPGEQRSGGVLVRLIDPPVGLLFEQLVRQARQLTFAPALPVAEHQISLNQHERPNGTGLQLNQEAPALAPANDTLVSDLAAEELETALVSLRRRAQIALTAHGINLLFVALGFLKWFDPTMPEQELRSPLLLLPVQLLRATAEAAGTLRFLDDEIMVNPLLLSKLQREHGLLLPALPAAPDALEPEHYFAQVAALVDGREGWQVLPDAVIGLFAIHSQLLHQDLEYAAAQPIPHPFLALLAGETLPPEAPAIPPLDSMPPDECYQVLDADADQQGAIAAARTGASFVLHGPPGTGKSQTITNIIAECMAQGKRVLFVSEKLAALQAVAERLGACGLGEFCLELYGEKASKSSLLADLATAIEPAELPPEVDFPYDEFTSVRDQLYAYAEALHTPLGSLRLTAYEVYARLASLQTAPDCDIPVGEVSTRTPEEMEQIDSLLQQIDARRELFTSLPTNPWQGCSATVGSFSERGRIRNQLRTLITALRELPTAAASTAALLGLPPPDGLNTTRALVELVELLRAPHTLSLWLDQPLTVVQYLQFDIADARQRYTTMADLEARLRQRYTIGVTGATDETEATQTEATQTEVPQPTRLTPRKSALSLDSDGSMLERFTQHYAGWTRFLRPHYYRDMGLLRAMLRPKKRLTYATALADLRLVNGLRAAQQRLEELIPSLAARSGRFFAGRRTDWEAYEAACEWTLRVLTLPLPHPLPEELRRIANLPLAEREALLAPATRLAATLAKCEQELTAFAELFPAPATLTDRFVDLFAETESAAHSNSKQKSPAVLLERIAELDGWWEFCDLRRRAESLGIAPYLDALRLGHPAVAQPRRAFHKRFHQRWLEHAYQELPPLRDFQPEAHAALIARFRELDTAQLHAAQIRLRRRLLERRQASINAPQYASELASLRHALEQPRTMRSIRQILRTLPTLVGQLKPCLLVSPLAVSQFLDPECNPFDLVIFDEASQVRTEVAIGAIMRGNALIVVGDTRQLPPTSFFVASAEGRNATIRQEEQPDTFTSILDTCLDVGMPTRMLQWHYRSRHEALIAFANTHFYAGRLATFPTASDPAGYGVSFEYVAAGTYDRRGTRTNQIEAQRVADLVCAHLLTTPHRSLGVVTFSQAQQFAILEELEQRCAIDPTFAQLFDETQPEPFFVSHIEHVQGDERDVIIISIGYGRDFDGRLQMDFGSLNQQGGEYRLNVAITRAREQVQLVSSLLPEEIDLGRARYPGPRLLRAYLEYARSGIAAQRTRPPEPVNRSIVWPFPDGAFVELPSIEDTVAEELAAGGLHVERQIGHSDFRIDIAIGDPQTPGHYLLGIAGDGSDYYSAHTVRDRERLREALLATRGWQIQRVWSAAWIADASAEIARVLTRLSDMV